MTKAFRSWNRANPDISQSACAVAQTSSLLYRGFPTRNARQLQTTSVLPTVCRLEVGDTAGWKPALRRWRRSLASKQPRNIRANSRASLQIRTLPPSAVAGAGDAALHCPCPNLGRPSVIRHSSFPPSSLASGGNFFHCWRVRLEVMKRKLKWVFGALLVVFALLQLTNPARTNPPILPGHDVSAAIRRRRKSPRCCTRRVTIATPTRRNGRGTAAWRPCRG